ncbi:MAG TPA: DUF4350 domain-containing protein [Candidatus Elarobacter sp.]|jgi:hypothetical protein|nr:DUF4350 domain-containing protein [Candidatus Elarobacter sp.]
MRRDYVLGAVALLALLAVSLLGHHEAPPVAATHASGDFSFGGYRAWYGLLAREGVRVQRFRLHHDALPRSGVDTLVVAFPDPPLPYAWNAAERDALRAWVRAGGRMIDVGLTPGVNRDDAKGERVFLTRARRAAGTLRGPWSGLVRDLAVRGGERLAPAKHARVETLLGDAAGALVVRYAYGRGEVVGVADAETFQNRTIGSADDARLAYLVARPRGNGVVAFDEAIRGDIVEKPWYAALTAPELVALGIAALAGLLWLAYGLVPLGPAVRLRAPREPTSEEFLDAVAALYQRTGARDHARDALARDARRSLERAPRTAGNAALAESVAAAEQAPVASDAALVAFAQVARAARENQAGMGVGAVPSTRARRRPARGARGGRP